MRGRGFLGTNASIGADISLIAGVLIAALLTIGVILARRRRYTAHRWVQTSAVSLNVAQVLAIMVGSFRESAAPGIPERINEPYYLVAYLHGGLGLVTLLFGIFVALRGNGLVPQALRFRNYKLFMRTAYGLYMLVTLLGIGVYITWYAGPPVAVAETAQPVALQTGEQLVPMANFVFNPVDLVVPVGTTVVWVNQDSAPHTATADDGAAFASELLATGERFAQRFDTEGTFPYFCELHGSAGGVDMAGTIRVVPAGQAPVAVAAPSIAAATPGPTPHPLPTELFGQPVGTAAFRDAGGSGDQLVVELQPPAGAGSLSARLIRSADNTAVELGTLAATADRLGLSYTAPDGGTLAGRFDRIEIGDGSGKLAASATLPPDAFAALAPLLARPSGPGYAVALRTQTDELLRHVRLVAQAQSAGDLAALRRHAEHVFNLVAGSRDPQFGDRDGDGRSQNPGDGFGLLRNGDQAGYIDAALAAATTAEQAPDATEAIKVHAHHVALCAENMQGWAAETRALALELTSASDPTAAQAASDQLLVLAQRLQRGDDANGDGEIAPVFGEGGALVAYEHALFMAAFGLFASN